MISDLDQDEARMLMSVGVGPQEMKIEGKVWKKMPHY